MPNITNDEIDKIIQSMYRKYESLTVQRNNLRKTMDSLRAIKYVPRYEEVSPAIPAEIVDGKVITPAKSATVKTIYDILPDDPLLPDGKLSEENRSKIFESLKGDKPQ